MDGRLTTCNRASLVGKLQMDSVVLELRGVLFSAVINRYPKDACFWVAVEKLMGYDNRW
jgi:hypothetical protein